MDRKLLKGLSHFRPMEFSTNLETVMSGWSILYIEGLLIIISPKKLHIVFFYIKIDFVLAHSEDPKITHFAAFHLGLHCLPKYPFMQ